MIPVIYPDVRTAKSRWHIVEIPGGSEQLQLQDFSSIIDLLVIRGFKEAWVSCGREGMPSYLVRLSFNQ